MFDLDHLQEIWTALSKNRLRTFLTAFGVFWGIFLLVLLLGSGNGLKNGMDAGFSGAATNSFFAWGMRTSKPFAGLPAGRSIEFTNADIEELRRQVPEAKVIAPRLQLGGHRGGATATRGIQTGSYSIMGDMPEIQTIQSLVVPRGRFLNHLDIEEKRKVAVIGSRVHEVLFEPEEDPLGQGIRINGVEFQVVGLFRSRQSGNDGDRDAETIFVPFSTYQQAFNAANRVHWMAVTSVDGVKASVVEKKVLDILRARHKVSPEDNRGIGHWNLEEEYEKIQGLFTGIKLLMWIVGVGTLAAGAIGVSNIMLIIVRERTKELGIRRAIGATPWKVQGQIVFEAVLLTLGSGLLGLSAGVGLLELVNRLLPPAVPGGEPQMFQNPGVTLEAAVLALAVLVASGVLAGLAPARRAVAITPMEALRS
ncbi:MAG: ABC transporter permease [Thermoanaerobaculia bacterium]|jgi:putative ABC transport system permease protein|nr:ABC transporter permease [Thermoanaerobaculia bacterium]MBP9825445.1 ABC transporter permease [Thermoanaerobaculia bacterium]